MNFSQASKTLTTEMMRRNTLICVFSVLHLFFGPEIQARWIFGPPGGKDKISGEEKAKENSLPALPKELPYKSDQEFFKSYCGFLQDLNLNLEACQNADTWRAKYQEIKEKQKIEETTTTGNPLRIIRVY